MHKKIDNSELPTIIIATITFNDESGCKPDTRYFTEIELLNDYIQVMNSRTGFHRNVPRIKNINVDYKLITVSDDYA